MRIKDDGLGQEIELPETKQELEQLLERPEQEQTERLRNCYFKICEIIDYYMDIEAKYISIIALWIIGTYFHEQFVSFPYLYINAMRGSGKSRLLRLMTILAKDGKMLNSMTEAVLFRTKGTIAIDEFESATAKEMQSLRELLNSGYKKGIKIIRMRKIKAIDGEQQVPEEFEVYRPILIANISGIDQVLEDRCISLILEKSNNFEKVMLIEDFECSDNIKNVVVMLNQCRLCSVCRQKDVYKDWNTYIKEIFSPTPTYTTTLTTLPTLPTQNTLFSKIKDTGIYGRNFELSIPLILIASWIGEDVVDITLSTLGEIIKEKKHEEEIESRDVMLIEFISKMQSTLDWTRLNRFCINFRDYADLTDKEESNEQVGRALKRLGLIIDKRRVSQGVEVILNIAKAKEKLKMFQNDNLNKK